MNERMEFKEIPIHGIKIVTAKAVLVYLEDDSTKWIPRSNLSYKDDEELEEGRNFQPRDSIRVATWFAEQENL